METVKDVHALSPQAATSFAPPPSPTARTAMAVQPPNAAVALDRLASIVSGVHGAVLASVDGFAIAKSATMPTEPSHAAMLAATVGLARQLVAMGGGSSLRQVVLDHDGGLLLVWPIGAERVLAVLADARVDQRALRSFVQVHVRALAERPTISTVRTLTEVGTTGSVR